MTNPTPAQIEAARAEIKGALVGLSDRSTSPTFIAERLDCAYAVLTAVAEVEEPEDWIQKRAGIRNSAIERCAQVAEATIETQFGNLSLRDIRTREIAAAIRALKDKP